MAEWRNWQTQQTQNLPYFTVREGSSPSSATIKLVRLFLCELQSLKSERIIVIVAHCVKHHWLGPVDPEAL